MLAILGLKNVRINSYDDAMDYMLSIGMTEKEIKNYRYRFHAYGPGHFAIIKLGGESIRDSLDYITTALTCLYHLKNTPVVLHGAGPQIDDEYTDAGISPKKIHGLRATPKNELQMVLEGYKKANQMLVNELENKGAGVENFAPGRIFGATRMHCDDGDLGCVGKIVSVNSDPIYQAIIGGGRDWKMPVLMTIGYEVNRDGRLTRRMLNINADHGVVALYPQMLPGKVIFVAEIGGIYRDRARTDLISRTNLRELEELDASGVADGGMGVKVGSVREILRASREYGRDVSIAVCKPRDLLPELYTDAGCGTCITYE